MEIIIPTKGRTNTQLTITFFPKELRQRTTFVCPAKEVQRLKELRIDPEYQVVAQPDPNWKIAAKRAWIIQEWARRGHDKIVMLDDDLRFSTRISADDWHLKEIHKQDLIPEFKKLEDKLGPEFPHVGFGQRQGNQNITEPGWKIPGKMCYVLGYYLPIVTRECKFDLVELREDMAISLQLLLKGYPNAILTETCVDQREFGKKASKIKRDEGGCARERTVEASNAEAQRLAELFPGYVSLIQRDYKSSTPRIEVICQWQKALEYGLSQRAKQAS